MKVSKKSFAIAAGALCAVSALAYSAVPQDEGKTSNICTSVMFFPETVKEAELLKKHAGALYDNAIKKGTPHDRMSLVYQEASKHIAAGKTVSLKAVPDTGTMTLADGSVRKQECYQMTVR